MAVQEHQSATQWLIGDRQHTPTVTGNPLKTREIKALLEEDGLGLPFDMYVLLERRDMAWIVVGTTTRLYVARPHTLTCTYILHTHLCALK